MTPFEFMESSGWEKSGSDYYYPKASLYPHMHVRFDGRNMHVGNVAHGTCKQDRMLAWLHHLRHKMKFLSIHGPESAYGKRIIWRDDKTNELKALSVNSAVSEFKARFECAVDLGLWNEEAHVRICREFSVVFSSIVDD